MTSTAIYNQNFISILNIKISHYLIHNTRKRRKLYFITKEDFWVDIQEAIDILKISESFSIPQKIWHIQNNNSNSPKCIGCDKSAKWQPGINMYGEFCCLVCSSKSKIKQLRMQDTCLEKYGVRNVFQLESVKQKSIETTQRIYGVDNISKLDSIKTKKEQTMFSNYNRYNNFGIDGEEFMMNKYGVRNAAQISSNSHLQHNRFKSRYNITLPSNITITVQGYERYAIPYILENICIESELLYNKGDMPNIIYYINDKSHRYFPDAFIPKDNTIIEVKSKYTLSTNLLINCAKFRSCIVSGHKVLCLVFDNKGNLIEETLMANISELESYLVI